MGKKLKKQIALILAGVVVFSSSLAASAATLKIPIELENLHVFTDQYSEGKGNGLRIDDENLLPKLKVGNYEKWIDRIELPEEIKEFYTVLEEAADFDGKEDFLIDPDGSSLVVKNADATSKGVLVTQICAEAADWGDAAKHFQKEFEEKYSQILAVSECFDRDHPEVFWLNGSTYIASADIELKDKYIEETDERIWTCTGNIYFMLESEAYEWKIWYEKYDSKDQIVSTNTMVENRVDELLDAVEGKTAAEKARYFNKWLTHNNEYSYLVGINEESSAEVITKKPDTFECTSALRGSVRAEGPVCEGYARAFKVLCDAAGIPCVLVDGEADDGKAQEKHMWNYIQVDENWYAVDVTWNDPLIEKEGAVSGGERETYFMIGSETQTRESDVKMRFIDSHPVENRVTENKTNYVNGPLLSKTSYDLNTISNPTLNPTMKPTPELTPEPTPEPTPELAPTVDASEAFSDVKPNTWYKDSVQYVYDKGLMSGSGGCFRPQDSVKRGQVLVTLYRLAGSPKTRDLEGLIKLEDVNPTVYYADAVCWAYNRGIITGTGMDNRYFFGEEPVKRQQLAALLRRYAQTMGQNVTQKADISYMLNANSVSSYAVDDVEWAVAVGLLNGSETKDKRGNIAYDLKPHDTATRAQMATILERFCETYGY